MFVRGLAAGTAGEADLLRHFDRYGVVDEVSIPRVVGEVDSLTGLPALRFAIVKFGHPEFAGLALNDREQVIDGQMVWSASPIDLTQLISLSEYKQNKACQIFLVYIAPYVIVLKQTNHVLNM